MLGVEFSSNKFGAKIFKTG